MPDLCSGSGPKSRTPATERNTSWARRQQSRAWELRARGSIARLWHQQGRRDEARDALAAVYRTYTEGFTTPDVEDAKTLLAALDH